MACCLIGTKPLSEPMLTSYELDPFEKYNNFINENEFENVCKMTFSFSWPQCVNMIKFLQNRLNTNNRQPRTPVRYGIFLNVVSLKKSNQFYLYHCCVQYPTTWDPLIMGLFLCEFTAGKVVCILCVANITDLGLPLNGCITENKEAFSPQKCVVEGIMTANLGHCYSRYSVWCHFSIVDFMQNTHNRHIEAHAVGCLWWVYL